MSGGHWELRTFKLFSSVKPVSGVVVGVLGGGGVHKTMLLTVKSVSGTVLTCEVCERDGWAGSSICKLFSHVKSASGVVVGVLGGVRRHCSHL